MLGYMLPSLPTHSHVLISSRVLCPRSIAARAGLDSVPEPAGSLLDTDHRFGFGLGLTTVPVESLREKKRGEERAYPMIYPHSQ